MIALARELARLMPDRQIPRLLNRSGKPTGYGNGWTQQRVRATSKANKSARLRHGSSKQKT
jgi:hypothetical protein